MTQIVAANRAVRMLCDVHATHCRVFDCHAFTDKDMPAFTETERARMEARTECRAQLEAFLRLLLPLQLQLQNLGNAVALHRLWTDQAVPTVLGPNVFLDFLVTQLQNLGANAVSGR
jgi:hypothetical protein